MQESTNIMLSNDCVEAIFEDRIDKLHTLHNELKNHKGIERLLSNYHNGASITFSLQQDTLRVDTDGEGWFDINYRKHVYSGCRDKDLDEDYQMSIEIKVNSITTEAILIGEDIQEREPDAY